VEVVVVVVKVAVVKAAVAVEDRCALLVLLLLLMVDILEQVAMAVMETCLLPVEATMIHGSLIKDLVRILTVVDVAVAVAAVVPMAVVAMAVWLLLVVWLLLAVVVVMLVVLVVCTVVDSTDLFWWMSLLPLISGISHDCLLSTRTSILYLLSLSLYSDSLLPPLLFALYTVTRMLLMLRCRYTRRDGRCLLK